MTPSVNTNAVRDDDDDQAAHLLCCRSAAAVSDLAAKITRRGHSATRTRRGLEVKVKVKVKADGMEWGSRTA